MNWVSFIFIVVDLDDDLRQLVVSQQSRFRKAEDDSHPDDDKRRV